MSELIQIDHYIFHLINEEWTNSFLDFIMPYWRDKTTWIPLYIFAIIFFVYRFKKQSVYIILGTLLCFGTADTISHKIIKKSVERARPCHDNSPLDTSRLLLEKCGPGFSFTSNHATNHFAIALFMIGLLGRFYPKLKSTNSNAESIAELNLTGIPLLTHVRRNTGSGSIADTSSM